MSKQHYEALYYPFIHFRHEQWIKAMTLYWDGFSRIVPSRHPTRDGDDIRRLIDAEVITDVFPSNRVLEKAMHMFRNVLQKHQEELLSRFSLSLIDTWREDPVTVLWADRPADPRLAYLHVDKMHSNLARSLEAMGLATMRHWDDRWIGMHPRLVDAYMVAIADLLAIELAAHPFTDDFSSHYAVATGTSVDAGRIATALLGVEAVERGPRDAEEVLVAVAFDSLLPDFRSVPVDTVLRIRESTVKARAEFQDGIAALVDPTRFEGAAPEAVGREMDRIYKKRIEPSLVALDDANKRFNVSVLKNTLSIKTGLTGMAAVAAAVGMAGGPVTWALGALAVGFGFHDVVVAASDERDTTRAEHPVAAYLATLRKELPAKELVELAVQ